LTQAGIATDGWRTVAVPGFIDLIGPLLRSTRADEKDLYALQTNDTHANPIGMIHGGVIAALLDQVMAISAWNAAGRQPTVTVQMDTRFLGSARAGDLLESRASVRHATRSLLFVDGEVSCAGKPVASATTVMKILKSGPEA